MCYVCVLAHVPLTRVYKIEESRIYIFSPLQLYIHRVKVSVCTVLRGWLDHGFDELNADMLADVQSFTSGILKQQAQTSTHPPDHPSHPSSTSQPSPLADYSSYAIAIDELISAKVRLVTCACA